jgi:phenylacetate-coenzyme A ligase PaaK-like adenylate-forming protein
MSVYGTSEAGILACGCGDAPGMHVNEDLVLVEPVDASGAPVAAGERSAKVLVTPLGDGHVLPLVRYEIDDQVVPLDEPCPCGSPLRRLAEVTGRNDETLVWGRTTLHPHVLRAVFAAHPAVLEYQVRATPNGVDVDVRPSHRRDVDLHSLSSDLQRALVDAGLSRPEVDVNEVAAVGRTGMGKLRRFVPLAR